MCSFLYVRHNPFDDNIINLTVRIVVAFQDESAFRMSWSFVWARKNGPFAGRGLQPTARVPHLAGQAISNGSQKLQVLRINFVMIHAEGILTLTCIKIRMLLAYWVIWNFFFWASCSNHCLAALGLGAGVEQPFDCLIIQNRQAMQSTVRSMDWTSNDNTVDSLFFCATLTGHRGGDTPFVQTWAETPNACAEAVKSDPASSWEGRSGGMGVGVGDENAESCGIVHPLRIPLLIHPLRCMYGIVVVRWTDELLCGGYKWVSRFEAPCICTRWTSERWMEQVSSLHGTACYRECDSTATKLSRLDACEDWKVVRWCRTQAFSHNSQGIVDGQVDEMGMNLAAPNRREVLCGWIHQG